MSERLSSVFEFVEIQGKINLSFKELVGIDAGLVEALKGEILVRLVLSNFFFFSSAFS